MVECVDSCDVTLEIEVYVHMHFILGLLHLYAGFVNDEIVFHFRPFRMNLSF